MTKLSLEQHPDAIMTLMSETDARTFSDQLHAYRNWSDNHEDFLSDLEMALNTSSAPWADA